MGWISSRRCLPWFKNSGPSDQIPNGLPFLVLLLPPGISGGTCQIALVDWASLNAASPGLFKGRCSEVIQAPSWQGLGPIWLVASLPSAADTVPSKPAIRMRASGQTAVPSMPFAHESEAELARFLDFYRVEWRYEPVSFALERRSDGRVLESFTPDFYLPEFELYVELTTMKQSLVTKKNGKIRKMRILYPEIKVKILYGRDYRKLLFKFGVIL